ncbi:MAG TPA: YjbE family putative metal transport protein [Rectinemataceae bacterium]|nr:YjbE family putative metal transport protein [Rectinemataceae bacterium]
MPTLDFDFLLRFVNITLINIALSGDNVIVIGMAAAALPPEKRKWALIFGGALAIVLRIILTSVATILTLVPYLSAVGGIVLIWVVYKLVRLDADSDSGEDTKSASSLRQAIFLILAADLMMSIDNVIAIAGSAHGSIPLLIAGLLISMPLLMMTGGFISTLIDKARWLVYLGAVAISYTAARMVFEDRAVEARFVIPAPIPLEVSLAAAVVIPGVIYLVGKTMEKRQAPAKVRAKL